MLTKQDVSAIRQVIKEELKNHPTHKDLANQLEPIKSDIATLKKDVKKIKTDIRVVINSFDREYLNLLQRVERIEEHLNLQRD